MEDYKKKYEEALERCKKEFNFNNLAYSHEEIKQRLERVFPELNDDERIKKEIIEYLEQSQFGEEHYQVDDDIVRGYIAWLEKQDQNRLEKEIELAYKTADEVQYRKGFEDGVASVKTAEWSEEDEKMCQNLLECTRNCWRKLPTDVLKYESWLKSLRPQPKQEWSEEDEWKFSDILALLRGGENFHYNTTELFDWLKSLKKRMKGE